MSIVNFKVIGRTKVASLKEGDMTRPLMVGPQITVSLHPDESGSLGVCEYSTSPYADVTGGGGRWIAWALGEVDEACSAITEGRITAIRVRCTAGSLAVEVV